MSFGHTQGVAVMWHEADHSERISDEENDRMLEHLHATGALVEAAAVMERIADGTDDTQIVEPNEVRRRLQALVDA